MRQCWTPPKEAAPKGLTNPTEDKYWRTRQPMVAMTPIHKRCGGRSERSIVILNLRDRNSWPDGVDPLIVDRSTKWGNPHKISGTVSRERAIELYANDFKHSPLRCDIEELWDRDLACWCAPLPCHASVLIEYLQEWLLEDKGY